MKRHSLRTYLLYKQVELLNRCNQLKSTILSENFTEVDVRNLEVAEGQLSIIEETLEICKSRGKF